MSESDTQITFEQLSLNPSVLKAVKDLGYEVPSPIQAESIPYLLDGHDVLGQAQTGTGKTAAFALPLLSRIDVKSKSPQVLVLAPTRELAIQVAEAFQSYSRYLKNFHVLPIYGGQSYDTQIRQLKRGVQVIVGTPGRVMDHMRKGTLKLGSIEALVLDEADEMLRMGFIDDVEWILEQTPDKRQIALFSATMPDVIKKVAKRHLNEPKLVKIKDKTATAATVKQRFIFVNRAQKLDALTRILEAEPIDGLIVFVRTKTATEEIAEKLEARGFACAALNGDIAQKTRERTVERLKSGKVDILVATDVVARGLDVERISHVINYDIPYDTEAYVHRIGRTGRAGRSGDAILFVTSREKRMLRTIEQVTKQPIEPMKLPTTGVINEQRIARFKQRITETATNEDLEVFLSLVESYQQEENIEPLKLAAALARMAQGDQPLLLSEKARAKERDFDNEREREPRSSRPARQGEKKLGSTQAKPLNDHPDIEMERFRVEVGYEHGVKPGNLVGAIANEADISSDYIGHIEIYEDFATIDLPAGMPKAVMQSLRKAWVCQQQLNIVSIAGGRPPKGKSEKKFGGKKSHAKKGSGKNFKSSDKRSDKKFDKKSDKKDRKKDDRKGSKDKVATTESSNIRKRPKKAES